MPAEPISRKHDRIGLWMILLAIIITTILFFWSSSQYRQDSNTPLNTQVDTQGHLHVLGITLGETNLKQAEQILQSKSDVALYIYPQEHPKAGLKLEAFFPAIADHTKVILLLDIPKKKMQEIESRATIPHQYQDGVARMNMAVDDIIKVKQAIISELTLIPNLSITAENLKARFGKPDEIKRTANNQKQYSYKSIGLEATISNDEPPMLHFSNP